MREVFGEISEKIIFELLPFVLIFLTSQMQYLGKYNCNL